jgi:hypothetical protein
MNIKKILFGEKTPDRDDPEYEKLRAKSEAAAAVQRFAERHTTVFWSIIVAYCLLVASIQINRIKLALYHRQHYQTAVERQRHELHFNRHHAPARVDDSNYNTKMED